MTEEKPLKWDAKLSHPTWSIPFDHCPKCSYPEAEGGYCPNCGWTLSNPLKRKSGRVTS